MLSRHADGLLWLGRYLERAADVNRLLNVAYNAQLEHSPVRAAEVWRNLLRVLNREQEFAGEYGEALTTENLNRFLILDMDQQGSVAWSVRQARTNVMNIRDAVPIELLEGVNSLHTRLATGQLARHVARSPHEIYDVLASDCQRIAGVVDDGMARDDTYSFLMLGRTLERAEMTCRVIEVNASVGHDDAATWMGVLRSLSGMHAFLRTHGPLATAEEIADFLLHDDSFPFSVLQCLRVAGRHLNAIGDPATWKSMRTLGRVASQVEYMDVPAADSPDFEDVIDEVLLSIRKVAEALYEDLYRHGREPSLFSFEAV